MKHARITLAVLALALTSTACSSVSTAPDQVALHYEGGSLSSQVFKGCVPASTKEFNGPGDHHYVYPASQRQYDFTGGDNADAGRIKIATKDVIEMAVPGIVQFELNTDCKALRQFHENYGNRQTAYFDDPAKPSKGWNQVLNQFIGKQIDATLDREALAYTWREIYADPAVKTKLEASVNESLQELVDRAMDGKAQHFKILSVQIQKPEPPDALKEALASEQTKVAAARAAEAEAGAQVKTAQAQKALAEAEAAKKQAEIAGYGGIEGYTRAKVAESGGNPFQPTYVVPQAGQ